MSRHLQQPLTKSGKPMTLSIAKNRLEQAISLCSEEDLRRERGMYSREEIRQRHKLIAEHDVKGLEEYYELEPAGRVLRRAGVVTPEEYAECVWRIIEPRIEAAVAAAMGVAYQRRVDDGHNGPMYSA